MAPTKKPGAAAWYALGNIHHDGQVYAPGDALPALTEAQVEALRTAGVLSAVPPVGDAPDEEQPEG